MTVREIYEWTSKRQVLTRRELGLPGLELLGHSEQIQALEPLEEHSHAHMELVFLLRGIQVYRVQGTDYRVQGGEAFLSQPKEIHSTGGQRQDVADFYWMQLDLAQENFLGLCPVLSHPLRDGLRRLSARVIPFDGEGEDLRRSFAALAAGSRSDRARGAVLLAGFLFDFLQGSHRQAPAVSSQMERVLAHIRANLTQPLALKDLAVTAGLSLPRFKVRFRQETGVTPREYINHAKIQEACRLLRSGKSVTQTAGELGFSTPNYFAVVFRKFIGKSPTQWITQ